MVTGARSRPNQLTFAAGSRDPPVAPTHRGRPGKNEQPRTVAGSRIGHHVPGLSEARAPR